MAAYKTRSALALMAIGVTLAVLAGCSRHSDRMRYSYAPPHEYKAPPPSNYADKSRETSREPQYDPDVRHESYDQPYVVPGRDREPDAEPPPAAPEYRNYRPPERYGLGVR